MLFSFSITALLSLGCLTPAFAQHPVRIRKEWSSLSPQERISYTDAVTCLMYLPSILPPSYNSPSHFDDFLVVHINHTWHIHLNGFFLPWHRNYVKIYEEALQTKCGYKGMQPYWDFSQPLNSHSPLFDGSPSSLGNSNNNSCISSGPPGFTSYRVPGYRLFDFSEALLGHPPINAFIIHNPSGRCLTRNISSSLAQRLLNQTRIDEALSEPNITSFRKALDPAAVGAFGIGLHAGGHRSIGGQMSEFFSSPADPAFFLLHAQIDRLWWLWQKRGVEMERVFGKDAISGTRTTLNSPSSANVTLEDWMNWGGLGMDRRVREVMDVGAEGLGYEYG